jgi:hypothetical protein
MSCDYCHYFQILAVCLLCKFNSFSLLVTNISYMLQNGIGYADHPYLSNRNGVMHGYDMKNPSQSRRSISGRKDGHFCEVLLCFLFIF